MTSPNKRRSIGGHHQMSVEEQALNLIAQEAENREANSNAVLAEARKIRTTELERIRKEQGDDDAEEAAEDEEVVDAKETKETKEIKDVKITNAVVVNPIVHSKSADDATDAVQTKLKPDELEMKYKKVMVSNAQLDNERQANQYKIELFKDQVSDLEEEKTELKRELQHATHELSVKTASLNEANKKLQQLEIEVQQRDDLIKANGLMVVSLADDNSSDGDKVTNAVTSKAAAGFRSTLLSVECLQVLSHYDGDSLGEKLQKFFDEKQQLVEENKRLQYDLEMETSRFALAQKYPIANEQCSSPVPGSASIDGVILDAETQKSVTENKFKLKKAEQEITTLQGAVTRLESQVNRYRQTAEMGEKATEELKGEKRRLQKELREMQVRVEDLESKNNHLLKRLEKTKTAKT